MKIKIFKDFIGDGFETTEIENTVNNFIKDKQVIDIKPTMIYDHEIGEGFITITILYDDIKNKNNDVIIIFVFMVSIQSVICPFSSKIHPSESKKATIKWASIYKKAFTKLILGRHNLSSGAVAAFIIGSFM